MKTNSNLSNRLKFNSNSIQTKPQRKAIVYKLSRVFSCLMFS